MPLNTSRRYGPGAVVAVSRKRVIGRPGHISTSYFERQNLTLRMQQRRFTRLSQRLLKKVENHVAAVSLNVAHYNFCWVHEALRVTPAMQLGLSDHVWTIAKLIEAAGEAPVYPERMEGYPALPSAGAAGG